MYTMPILLALSMVTLPSLSQVSNFRSIYCHF